MSVLSLNPSASAYPAGPILRRRVARLAIGSASLAIVFGAAALLFSLPSQSQPSAFRLPAVLASDDAASRSPVGGSAISPEGRSTNGFRLGKNKGGGGGASASGPRFELRLDWTDLPPKTPLGKKIEASQRVSPSDCGRNMNKFKLKSNVMVEFGLGSSLHLYSQSLCHAFDNGMVVINDPTEERWLWNDESSCRHVTDSRTSSPLQCYFGLHESASHCADSGNMPPASTLNFVARSDEVVNNPDRGRIANLGPCHAWPDYPKTRGHARPETNPNYDKLREFRAASMEWLFSSVRPAVIREAEHQAREAFGHGGGVPDDLVTVHIRWGDKGREMKRVGGLIPMERYIAATEEVIAGEGDGSGGGAALPRKGAGGDVHIYLSSEDPRAIAEFKRLASSRPGRHARNWIVHTSGPTNDPDDDNMVSNARRSGGRDGLESLGALLLSLEADRYVLTGASNWSRLIDELRRNVVNPRCGDCTRAIDVAPMDF